MKRHRGPLNAYHYVKQVNIKRLQVCDPNYMIFWKRWNFSRDRTVVARGDGRLGEIQRQNVEDFEDSENIMYDTVMTGIHYYTLVQTYKIFSTKSEP